MPTAQHDCQLVAADMDGAFPEGFYSTTNQRTEVRLGGHWIEVDRPGDGLRRGASTASADRPLRAHERRPTGARVRRRPCRRAGLSRRSGRPSGRMFEFMGSSVSSEKPKGVAIREVAQRTVNNRAARRQDAAGRRAGDRPHRQRRARLPADPRRLCRRLFAGNALATHDIEQALFGTSLGVYLERGGLGRGGARASPAGDQPHSPRRRHRQAVETGVLTSGIMYECVRHDVDFLLAGSIRDDGPLPEVITDVLEAQRQMREQIRDVTFCLMIATTLHSIAVGNLLPAWVKVVCVDINPSTVIKLNDRGSFQTVGLVTDVEPFSAGAGAWSSTPGTHGMTFARRRSGA